MFYALIVFDRMIIELKAKIFFGFHNIENPLIVSCNSSMLMCSSKTVWYDSKVSNLLSLELIIYFYALDLVANKETNVWEPNLIRSRGIE